MLNAVNLSRPLKVEYCRECSLKISLRFSYKVRQHVLKFRLNTGLNLWPSCHKLGTNHLRPESICPKPEKVIFKLGQVVLNFG